MTTKQSYERDHPRVCGEKLPESTRRTADEGSPPRVRGEGEKLDLRSTAPGITPACAGRRLRFLFRFRHPPDHPRVCGEKPGGNMSWGNMIGSPPRVRGEAP